MSFKKTAILDISQFSFISSNVMPVPHHKSAFPLLRESLLQFLPQLGLDEANS